MRGDGKCGIIRVGRAPIDGQKERKMDTTQVVDTPDTFEILGTPGRFYITRNGVELRDGAGFTRYFNTRNSARKRIARERSGDFHR